ncbi:transglycosylase domain-containing protein [Dictyobacter formicarum]|uniref:Penicillin-insensitive transglycosylase n=1 Tax=Dictyobacter formicarum TaxID=2778368 RepID=A0ABQ3VU74_9CHLR|nr:transglycosylase domain-containing protein [Dictyobacter formicarum]GHO88938.1 hypothetical protein KSZ_69440 [Dictyobacter formicarum]
MSDNWNPNSDANQSSENNRPPKTGGLLSNFKAQQSGRDVSKSQPLPGANSASSPAGPQRNNSSLLRGGYQQYSPSAQGGQPVPPQAGQGMQQKPQSPQAYNAANQQGLPAPGPQPGQQYPRQPQAQPMTAQQRHRMLSNAVDMMRRWSGKMAAVAGHQVQPPAPYMDHYRPPSTPAVEMSPSSASRPWKRSRTLRINQQIRQRRMKMHQGGPKRVLVIALLSLLGLVVMAAFGSSAYGYGYYMQQQPRMEEYANQHIDQNTRIYDRNGVLLYEAYDNTSSVYSGRRVTVRYEDVPLVMQNAMTSIEDKTFWTNSGIDPLAIVRAGTSSYGGASTLTQQVIKNLTRNNAPTYQRKLTEAAMAIGLTQQYSKSKIMEMYFNVAPFGAQTYGVEVATEDYFGLKPSCKVDQVCVPGISKLDYDTKTKKHDPILALARASFLAGQPNAPSATDPTLGTDNKQRALDRQKLVLNAMINQGMTIDGKPDSPRITEADAKKAEDLMAKQTFTPYKHFMLAPHFVEYVIGQMAQALGGGNAGAHAFLTGGYNIRTSIDINLVNYIQNEVTRHIYQPDVQKVTGAYVTLSENNNVHDAAVVVMDSKTGEILGMNGSADFNSQDPRVNGQYNVAIHARPPGSTFKPFDYATAFQMGWNPGIMIHDGETIFPTHNNVGQMIPTTKEDVLAMSDKGVFYAPTDYGQLWNNADYSVRKSTAGSLNIAAIKTMQFAGGNAVLNTMQRLGINDQVNDGLAWAIGARDITPLQMANAYQTFANNGVRVQPQSILDVWDNLGHNLFHYNLEKPVSGRVFSPQVSYLMTSVLIDEPDRLVEFSGDHDLSFTDKDSNCAVNYYCEHQVAAKTGTTDSFRDNWTVGYTPDVTVAVWVGNADNSPMYQVIGITGAAPIWHNVIERAVGYCNEAIDGVPCGPDYHFRFSQNPTWKFPVPTGVTQTPLSAATGLQGGGQMDYVIDGQAPLQP